ncbi:MAG: OmpA family protein [Crocinitomicaceae bacterium]|nr:OmpA family protein [Crocinitomicaceae bacterium]
MVNKWITYCLVSIFCCTTFAQEQEVDLILIETQLQGNVYGPAFFRDKIVVCSDQKDHFFKTVLDESDKMTTDLYELDTSGNYQRFSDLLRTDFNEGPASFDENGSQMVFTRNVYIDDPMMGFEKKKNPLGLFESSFKSNNWSTPRILPFVDSTYQYMHPGLNETGDKLVFASNRPGGFGGFDIWISINDGSGWSEPVNAGAGINTKSNELFPSISDRSIYFASDRRGGMGGLDIYSHDTSKTMSIRLKAPINSVHDDFGLICKNGMSEGYFASNRNNKDEIWKFTKETEVIVECDSLIPNILCYTLTEQQAAELGEVENLVYVWNINEDKVEGISIDYCFPGEGGYEITLDIIDTVVNQTFFNQAYYYLEIRFAEQPYISSPDTVLVDDQFELSSGKTNLPNAEILGYEWSISDGTTYPTKNAKHAFESPGVYRVELTAEIKLWDSTFFDCVYKVVHCYEEKVLADIREAENILEDTSKVIQETQFFAEHTDSSNTVYSIEVIRTKEKLPNDNFLFTLMESYGKVYIHYIEEKDEYSYLVGDWDNIEDAHPAWQEFIKEGYDEAVVRSIDLDLVSTFSLDNSFELENVTFDEGKWDIKKEAIPDLQNIVEIMLIFPDVNLKIEAHTNSRGDDEDNLQLSIKRAESVKGYIVSKGIDPTRITAEGFGETKPKQSNDTPEGLKANRRVEFTFVK